MKHGELLAKFPTSHKKGIHDVAQFRHVAGQIPDAFLELSSANDANLQTKIAQQPTDIILDRNGLLLQQFSCSQQNAPLLACQRFDVDRSEQIDAHHLCDAASVISVSLVNLRLQERLSVPCLNADRRQAGFRQTTEQP